MKTPKSPEPHVSDLKWQTLRDYGHLGVLQPITFGKHSGTPIKDLPSTYLWWLLGNITDDDKRWIRAAANCTLRFREKQTRS